MSSNKATGKTGPGSTGAEATVRGGSGTLPALSSQAPTASLERHAGTALFLRESDLPQTPGGEADLFSRPWSDLLASCHDSHHSRGDHQAQPSILLAETGFGLNQAAEFHFETLLDAEIRVVIAPFFGTALISGAVRHGVLLIPLPLETIRSIATGLAAKADAKLAIDLRGQTIEPPQGGRIAFQTHPWLRTRLLHGMDNFDEQLRHRETARKFRAENRKRSPWLYRGSEGGESA